MNPREIDLRKLNSLTKYPSIPTYHDLGEREILKDTHIQFPKDEKIFLSEKIDGANTRIIVFPTKRTPTGGFIAPFIIGSREELLCYSGDLIHNPALGIVDAIRRTASRIASHHKHDALVVYYVEVFGGKTTRGAKNYSRTGKVSFRLFDVFAMPIEDAEEMIETWPIEKFSGWREREGQNFFDLTSVEMQAKRVGLDIVPKLGEMKPQDLPEDHEAVLEFLKKTLPKTNTTLDGKSLGQAEGIVVRTYEREVIAKIKFRDYERTIRAKNELQKRG